MKKIFIYILVLAAVFACQRIDIADSTASVGSDGTASAEIVPSCIIQAGKTQGPGVPMTKSLIGKETTAALMTNFVKVDETMPQSWTLESQYDMRQTSFPSFQEAQIVEAEVLSSAASTSDHHLRSASFNPRLAYKFVPREGSAEPEVAYVTRMVGWYPMTYDVPDGLGEEDALAQFGASGCMKVIDGKVCVEFKDKLDCQTDLMMSDMREGRMQKTGFRHATSGADRDVQPFGHFNSDPLDPMSFDYINYFTFHHYLSAVRLFIKASSEDRGKAIWTILDNIKVLDQPASAVISLPTEQARDDAGQGIVAGTSATLPSEGVPAFFGEIQSWSDYRDFDIVRTPMFANNGLDESYMQPSNLPFYLPNTGEVQMCYLGYALVQPDETVGDGRILQVKLFTDAGTYLLDVPETDSEGNHILQPGMMYDLVIDLSAIGGINVVIRNDDDDKYEALAPFNYEYDGYEYSNCYVITKDMIRHELEDHYDGYYFRAWAPGRGARGDIPGDAYSSGHELEPAYAKIYAQSETKPLEHCELVQGYVRFNLDSRTSIDDDGELTMFPGNAIIAAYDDDDNLVWSWHIWVVEELNEVTIGDVTVLDRNLGALWAPSASDPVDSGEEALQTYGYYYQWGRKDPTYEPMRYDYDINDMRTETFYTMDGVHDFISEVYMVGAAPTIEHSVRNPLVILSPSDVSPVYSNDWLWTKNDDLWGRDSGKKTIYDPCPYGYKVPEGELRTIFGSQYMSYGTYGAVYDRGGSYLFFPYAGWKGDDVNRVSRTHAWMKVGVAGDYQDATYNETTFHRGRSLIARENFTVTIYGSNVNSYVRGLNYGYTNRTAAASVRCVKYDGEPLRTTAVVNRD